MTKLLQNLSLTSFFSDSGCFTNATSHPLPTVFNAINDVTQFVHIVISFLLLISFCMTFSLLICSAVHATIEVYNIFV